MLMTAILKIATLKIVTLKMAILKKAKPRCWRVGGSIGMARAHQQNLCMLPLCSDKLHNTVQHCTVPHLMYITVTHYTAQCTVLYLM